MICYPFGKKSAFIVYWFDLKVHYVIVQGLPTKFLNPIQFCQNFPLIEATHIY